MRILYAFYLLLNCLDFVKSMYNKSLKLVMRNYTFLLDDEGWMIEGNQRFSTNVLHIPYTFNNEMSHFITGNDSLIHVNPMQGEYTDKSLWYFRSPILNADLSNYKYINFSLSCFSGISNSLNQVDHYIRICGQKAGQCSKYRIIDTFNLTKKWTTFHIPLDNKLLLWTDKFNIIIRNVSYIYILGDWTQWYETIGLDNFFIG